MAEKIVPEKRTKVNLAEEMLKLVRTHWQLSRDQLKSYLEKEGIKFSQAEFNKAIKKVANNESVTADGTGSKLVLHYVLATL